MLRRLQRARLAGRPRRLRVLARLPVPLSVPVWLLMAEPLPAPTPLGPLEQARPLVLPLALTRQ